MYQPKVTVKTAAEVKAILGKDFPSQVAKIIDHIDSHCRAWIERCPFVVISSTNAAGAMDVSPKGDPPGFVKVLDKHTLAVPDRMTELALLVRVREAFFHCGKSMIRSGMWEPDRWGSIDGLPTYAQALKDHANLSAPLSDIERGVASNETDRLY
jgi:uncharacterized protein